MIILASFFAITVLFCDQVTAAETTNPPAKVYPSGLEVTDGGAPLTDTITVKAFGWVNSGIGDDSMIVRLSLTHNRSTNDLEAYLYAPDGVTNVKLFGSLVAQSLDFGAAKLYDNTDRENIETYSESWVLTEGDPLKPAEAFSGFNGCAVDGEWKLVLNDKISGNGTYLKEWELIIPYDKLDPLPGWEAVDDGSDENPIVVKRNMTSTTNSVLIQVTLNDTNYCYDYNYLDLDSEDMPELGDYKILDFPPYYDDTYDPYVYSDTSNPLTRQLSIVYTPTLGVFGPDTFTYEISSDQGDYKARIFILVDDEFVTSGDFEDVSGAEPGAWIDDDAGCAHSLIMSTGNYGHNNSAVTGRYNSDCFERPINCGELELGNPVTLSLTQRLDIPNGDESYLEFYTKKLIEPYMVGTNYPTGTLSVIISTITNTRVPFVRSTSEMPEEWQYWPVENPDTITLTMGTANTVTFAFRLGPNPD
jgi:subtilisin-like proprotein convertase family protein